MSGEITLSELTASLDSAAKTIDSFVKPVIAATARNIKTTQKEAVQVRSGRTRARIQATGPGGTPLGSALEAEIGPAGPGSFVGRLLEFGTSTMAPRSFIAESADPWMEDHLAATAEAARRGALHHLTGL